MSLSQANATKITGESANALEGVSLALNASVAIGTNCATLCTGTNNTFVGFAAGEYSTTGSSNVVVGFGAGSVLAGDGNAIYGFLSGMNAKTGRDNVFVGNRSGNTCATGSGNVTLGAQADVSSGTDILSVAVGVGARSGTARSVAVGANALAHGNAAIAIGSGVSAVGDRAFNIADRLRGRTLGTAPYAVEVDASVLKVPGVLAMCDPDQQPRWWFHLDKDEGENIDLVIRSANNSVTRFRDDFYPGMFNFTGQHRCDVIDADRDRVFPGCVVVSAGMYRESATIDDAVPVVMLSGTANDPRVFGVASAFERPGEFSDYRIGNMEFRRQRDGSPLLIVNAVGEGAVWACDANGPLKNGDLLTTSHVPGVAMRQDGPFVTNHTLGKVTCDCDFGNAERRALVGISFKC